MKQTKISRRRFRECGLRKVRPEGILREVLLAQKNGMPGHLDEIGYPYQEHCWGLKRLTDGGYQEWWPYEQTAYWIDSMIRLSILLEDQEVYGKVKDQIKRALENAADGFIGPEELKQPGKRNQWPHAILFRALIALAQAGEEFSGFTPEELYAAMAAHYKTGTSDYTCFREVVNTESMLKLYELTGDKELLALAVQAYEGFNRQYAENDSSFDFLMSDQKPNQHGVTYNEQAKLPAIFYLYTGDEKYLEASLRAYEKIDRWFMLPDGVHSSCEFTLGNDSLQAHETCDIADYTWSMGYLLMATGRADFADRIERACLNAAFGAIGPDFRTIKYLSSPNQVLAARNSTHTVNFRNTPRFAYQPHHYPECCIGNVGRIFPNYAARMYMETQDGVVLALYGESRYLGDGFTLTQKGRYPFSDTITVSVSCKEPVKTSLLFRIPEWCGRAVLKKNGRILYSGAEDLRPENGFFRTKGALSDGDLFCLTLPMEVRGHESADGGRYFTFGPLLLTLALEERFEIDPEEKRQTEEFPAYNVYPQASFAFCVARDYNGEGAVIRFGEKTPLPWWDTQPLKIRIPARTLPGYECIHTQISIDPSSEEKVDDTMIELGASSVTKELVLTPPLPSEEFVKTHAGEETWITLVPYGTAHARLTVFPVYERDKS